VAIRRVSEKVTGIDNQSGELAIRIEVEPTPLDDEWIGFFRNPTALSNAPAILHTPEVDSSGKIHVRCSDDEVEKVVQHVDARIEHANTRWEAEVRPRLQEQQDHAERQAKERQARIDDAQRRLDEM
jgi:hypothetical protein